MTNEAIASHVSTDDKMKSQGDYLDFLQQVQKKDPSRMSDQELYSALFVNL